MRRLSIDATEVRCAMRAWDELCGRPRAQRTTIKIIEYQVYFFRLRTALQQKKQHTEHPRQHAAAVFDKAHGDVIDVASAPRQPSTA